MATLGETTSNPAQELRSIIVTGASSGIGAHCARALKTEGWRVFATARKPEDIAALEADGIEAFYLDYSEPGSIAELVTNLDSGLSGWPETKDASRISSALITPKAGVPYGDLVSIMDVLRKHQIVNLGVVPAGAGGA